MRVKVLFRFNKVTGEVEVFQVEDTGPAVLPIDEHNRLHDQIAAEVGNVLERNPYVTEVLPGAEPVRIKAVTPPATALQTEDGPAEPEPESEKTQRRQGA